MKTAGIKGMGSFISILSNFPWISFIFFSLSPCIKLSLSSTIPGLRSFVSTVLRNPCSHPLHLSFFLYQMTQKTHHANRQTPRIYIYVSNAPKSATIHPMIAMTITSPKPNPPRPKMKNTVNTPKVNKKHRLAVVKFAPER